MRRISLFLPPGLDDKVQRLMRDKEWSQTQVIRRGLEELFDRKEYVEREEKLLSG